MSEHRAVALEALRNYEVKTVRLAPAAPVHGDLAPQNVIVSPRHGLVPIDFQDTVQGAHGYHE
jgi:Ser/Thr protein kinase RdoA (MazF antagonist)